MPAITNAISLPGKAVWRQAIRMTVAALLAYAATGILGFHHGYWAVITCLVVVQGSLGATISAGLARVAGTAAGAVAGGIGAVVSLLYPGIPEWIVLFLVIAPLALLSASRAVFKLAPLTGALVLLLAGSGSLGFAFSRVAEIALGTLIGVLASLFVLPERATAVLVDRAASLLELIGAFGFILLSEADTHVRAPAHDRLALQLRAGFAQLQGDMKEVAQERNVRLLRSDPFPEQLSRHLQRLRTDVNMLGRAASARLDTAPALNAEDSVLAERIRQIFLDYAAALRSPASLAEVPALTELTPANEADTPLGFALLTLQGEFKALQETLLQWSAALAR